MNLYAEVVIEHAREVLQLDSGEPVPSPCNSVCRVDAQTGWCEGCFRTLDEIAVWGRLEDGEKRTVWSELADRARTAPPPSSL